MTLASHARPSTRRSYGALATAGALSLVLAACSTGESVDVGGGGDGGAGGDGGTVIAAISTEPDQLDPNSTTSYGSFQVLENVYDTLVQPDENLEMQPALAESWETSEDQLTWTFHIRDGVTWHDGSDFTAEDVVYSYNRIIDEELAPSWRFSNVEEVSAPDESTVEIRVSSPSPNLLANIGGYKGVAIVQRENVESGEITNNPIGTGPFAFEDYATGASISLSANGEYWDGAPAVDGVEFRFIGEPTTAIASLQSGDIHWTDNIPPQQADSLGTGDVEVGQVGSNDYWYLVLNGSREPWSSAEARQAVSWAIDRDAITEATMFGKATVNQTAIPESSSFYYDYAPYSHDPARAQELLTQAGVDPAATSIDLMVTSEYPETVAAAQVIASQLGEIGISVTPRTVDFGTWLDEQGQGNYDMLMLGWLGNIDPDDFYYSQHHTDGANNHQHYSNPEVDRLLDEGRVETEDGPRKEIYDQVAQHIVDDASYIYLYNPDVIQAWSTDLEGYEARSDRAIRFKDIELAG